MRIRTRPRLQKRLSRKSKGQISLVQTRVVSRLNRPTLRKKRRRNLALQTLTRTQARPRLQRSSRERSRSLTLQTMAKTQTNLNLLRHRSKRRRNQVSQVQNRAKRRPNHLRHLKRSSSQALQTAAKIQTRPRFQRRLKE